MSNKIIPEKLKLGDTIGIVCPSAGINNRARHRIEGAKKYLELIGFKVKLGKSIFVEDGQYTSGSIEARVDDLHSMFSDPEIKMILCGTGGNHSDQLLRYLDYELIKNNPKIFMGYSDITIMHYALYTQADLITYYGPCAATQFGEFPQILDYTKNSFWDEVVLDTIPRVITPSDGWTEEFLDWFQQTDLTRARMLEDNDSYMIIRTGKATARITPTCVMSVNRIAGTKYWINPDSNILVLDVLLSQGELDFPLLDAYLTDLFNIGAFDNLKGLLISRLAGFTTEDRNNFYERISQLTKHTDYPIVGNFDIGHTDPINTLRYDQLMTIDTESKAPITILD
jgi:muramoyltetrapeptide carboxypeptidase